MSTRIKVVGVVVMLTVLGGLLPTLVSAQSSTTTLWLPVVYNNVVQPQLELTFTPACNSYDHLIGKTNLDPSLYKINVYIYMSGWWTKPYYTSPDTPIRSDRTWETDVTTGGNDPMAAKFAVFAVPKTYTAPLMSGGYSLPDELFQNAVTYLIQDRPCSVRQIEFSGYTWNVKATAGTTGPGPNHFSDLAEDVFVDQLGRLHLRIVQRNGIWYCTEVINTQNLGYGSYVFHLGSRIDQINENAVLGLFTWDDTSADFSHREIDIEFSRWGDATNDNSQYVVQPFAIPDNLHRFNTVLPGDASTHGFEWRSDLVYFQSLQGDQQFPGVTGEIQSWTYTGGSIPPPGLENARINLWLYNGTPPSDGQPVEVIVDKFEFLPVP